MSYDLDVRFGPSHGPLTDYQVEMLAAYNARRSQGIVHEPEYAARMALLQGRWNDWAGRQVGRPLHRSWLRRVLGQ